MATRKQNLGSHWERAFVDKARAHWTTEQLQAQLGTTRLLLDPRVTAPLLRALDLLQRDATMSPRAVRKFMQINHVVTLLEPLLRDLVARHELVRLVDVASGRSQLTVILAWCFVHLFRHPVQLLGVDRNRPLIDKSNETVLGLGLEQVVKLVPSTIEEVGLEALWEAEHGKVVGPFQLHGLFALHACDTATDAALALGVRQRVDMMAVVPCCHAELSRGWQRLDEEGVDGAFALLWRSPHLRREAAATMTDALRTLLVEAHGYRVTPMELVPSEHTPKNTLLRATRSSARVEAATTEYQRLKAALGGVTPTLERLLGGQAQQPGPSSCDSTQLCRGEAETS